MKVERKSGRFSDTNSGSLPTLVKDWVVSRGLDAIPDVHISDERPFLTRVWSGHRKILKRVVSSFQSSMGCNTDIGRRGC